MPKGRFRVTKAGDPEGIIEDGEVEAHYAWHPWDQQPDSLRSREGTATLTHEHRPDEGISPDIVVRNTDYTDPVEDRETKKASVAPGESKIFRIRRGERELDLHISHDPDPGKVKDL